MTRGDEVVIAPTKKKARVEAIFIDEKNVSSASLISLSFALSYCLSCTNILYIAMCYNDIYIYIRICICVLS